MRFLYPILFLSFFLVNLDAQIREIPIVENPVLKSAFAKKQVQEQQEFFDLMANWPDDFPQGRQNCPLLEPGVAYVIAGDSVSIEVDTIGQGGGGTLRILQHCSGQPLGSARLDKITVIYLSNPGTVAGRDTVCVEFCKANGSCQTLRFPVVVKRADRSYVLPAIPWQPSLLDTVRVNTSVLPGNLSCSELLDCPDTYDGEGEQSVWFPRWGVAEGKLVYRAARFPGIDTVCLWLCDDYTICDTFKILIAVQGGTLRLPFFDDFAYAGPYPSTDHWLDDRVYVNTSIGKNAPSTGMATFDGLNTAGRPYDQGFGPADFLTSRAIDLSGLTANNNVVLSFYLQPKGLGFQPRLQDSLIIEFRNNKGVWMSIGSFAGLNFIPLDSVPPFVYNAFGVSDPQFFHKAFQFRFKNLNTGLGPYGMWHLDYVRLDANRDASAAYNDIAFFESPRPALKNYAAMPLAHFRGFENQETSSEVTAGLYSNFSYTENIDRNLTYLSIEGAGRNREFAPFPFLEPKNIESFERFRVTKAIPNEPGNNIFTQFGESLKNEFNDAKELNIRTRLQLELTRQAIPALRNDSIQQTTKLGNYFAYDDGTAERAIEANGVGAEVAVKFRANVDDYLKGVQLHIPHVNGDVRNQLFNIRIWIDKDKKAGIDTFLNRTPDYEMVFQRPVYTDSYYDTLQGFTTYVLSRRLDSLTRFPVPDSLFIPAGADFYVGWQQATSTSEPVPIGYDKNNSEASQHIWFKRGRKWERFDQVYNFKGAVMMRPVLGKDPVIPTIAKDRELIPGTAGELLLFPNPTAGRLHLATSGISVSPEARIRIFDFSGRQVLSSGYQQVLDLSHFPEGIYILRLTDAEAHVALSRSFVVSQE